MKTINKTLIPTLDIAIKESLRNYESKNDDNSLGDLFLYYEQEDNILFIYDDQENLLNEIQLPRDEVFNTATLRFMLQSEEQVQLFDRDYIFKPFTINLVDRNFAVIEEIFFLDDDTIQLGNNLWNSVEKELDNFLKDLLK
jgi:hypothetical protein